MYWYSSRNTANCKRKTGYLEPRWLVVEYECWVEQKRCSPYLQYLSITNPTVTKVVINNDPLNKGGLTHRMERGEFPTNRWWLDNDIGSVHQGTTYGNFLRFHCRRPTINGQKKAVDMYKYSVLIGKILVISFCISSWNTRITCLQVRCVRQWLAAFSYAWLFRLFESGTRMIQRLGDTG